MHSSRAARVLHHYRAHAKLPTTRDAQAYSALCALRKGYRNGTLAQGDADALAECGAWQQPSRIAHNRGKTGPNQTLIAERVEEVGRYLARENKLPPGKSQAGQSLTYLRQVIDDIPHEMSAYLDSLNTGWRFTYRGSQAQFADMLDMLVQWRKRYPRRWPRATLESYSENQLAIWLRRQRMRCKDPKHLRELDRQLPGWNS